MSWKQDHVVQTDLCILIVGRPVCNIQDVGSAFRFWAVEVSLAWWLKCLAKDTKADMAGSGFEAPSLWLQDSPLYLLTHLLPSI